MNDNIHRIAFVSTMAAVPWGGSELLWSQAALHLARQGHVVSANVLGWPERVAQISALMKMGISVSEREAAPIKIPQNFLGRACSAVIRNASLRALSLRLVRERPDLICISSGSPGDDITLIDRCVRSGRPYVLITQANAEGIWPKDILGSQMIKIFRGARCAYFVSNANRQLLETQLGVEITNAEVIRNPFNVRWEASPPWPLCEEPIRFACVARLEPPAKGQDLILQVMASEPWRSRPVEVSFYGNGPMEEGLRRLTHRFGLNERVRFCGHESDIELVWATHHALLLPSRFEGLPLAIVEAMLCGRPVIVTDVAGNAELVEEGVTGFVAGAPTVRHLNEAMEKAWACRRDWESMGKASACSIRKQIPTSPSAEFAQQLLEIIRER